LRNDSVEVEEAWRLNVEILLADVVDRFVINLVHTIQKLNEINSPRRTMKEQSTCSRVVWVVRMLL